MGSCQNDYLACKYLISLLQNWREASRWDLSSLSPPLVDSLAFLLVSASSRSLRSFTGLLSDLAGMSFRPAKHSQENEHLYIKDNYIHGIKPQPILNF